MPLSLASQLMFSQVLGPEGLKEERSLRMSEVVLPAAERPNQDGLRWRSRLYLHGSNKGETRQIGAGLKHLVQPGWSRENRTRKQITGHASTPMESAGCRTPAGFSKGGGGKSSATKASRAKKERRGDENVVSRSRYRRNGPEVEVVVGSVRARPVLRLSDDLAM